MCLGFVSSQNPGIDGPVYSFARRRVIVAEKGGAMSEVEVDVFFAVHIPDAGSLSRTDVEGVPEAGVVAARGADAAGKEAFRFGAQVGLGSGRKSFSRCHEQTILWSSIA